MVVVSLHYFSRSSFIWSSPERKCRALRPSLYSSLSRSGRQTLWPASSTACVAPRPGPPGGVRLLGRAARLNPAPRALNADVGRILHKTFARGALPCWASALSTDERLCLACSRVGCARSAAVDTADARSAATAGIGSIRLCVKLAVQRRSREPKQGHGGFYTQWERGRECVTV